MRFEDYTIGKKLMAMSLWASSGALLMACVAFMTYDHIVFKAFLVKNLTSLSEIISLNAASAVTFNDSAAANHTLEALKARPATRRAAIYSPQGEVFAHWERS